MSNDNSEISHQYRQLAAFFELHPELIAPAPNVGVWLYDKADGIKAAKMPGARKEYSDTTLRIEVPVTGGLTVSYYLARETVCTAKRIEIVTQPAVAERTYEKVVEWDCHPLLAPTPEPAGTPLATVSEEVSF